MIEYHICMYVAVIMPSSTSNKTTIAASITSKQMKQKAIAVALHVDFGSYKLLKHATKVVERISENRIWQQIQIGDM